MADPTGLKWRSLRTTSEQPAKIILERGPNIHTRPCTVINISLSGLRIRLDDKAMLPNSFTLVFDGKQLDCDIVWRKGNDVGATAK